MLFIGLFDKREKELENEKKVLLDNIMSLEGRLRIARKSVTEKTEKLEMLVTENEYLEKLNIDYYKTLIGDQKLIANRNQTIEELQVMITEKESRIRDYEQEVDSTKKMVKDLQLQVKQLMIENLDLRKKPSYKVGRKSKINDDIIKRTRELNSENKSLMGIAEILEKETGIAYSKSTVKKILDLYIKGNQTCENN